MSRRYFSESPIEGRSVTLAGSEAHHLLHVLRASPGMLVLLFDGSGRECEAEVAACSRSTVDLVVLGQEQVDRELPFSLTLGVALPKGDRQRWIIEKATELGVTRLVPLVTERSIGSGEKHAAEKLTRYVIEASKQCGRNRLMQIAEPFAWEKWLAVPEADDASRSTVSRSRKWIAHPADDAIQLSQLKHQAATFLAIGPEGGL